MADPFVNLVDKFILDEIQSSGIDKPILVTNDRIFQLQARLRGIKSEIYKESVPFKSAAEYFIGFVATREDSVPNAFMTSIRRSSTPRRSKSCPWPTSAG